MFTNSTSFKFFFKEYFEPVFQFARKYTEEEASARDITQDAFIKLYERRTDFDSMEKAKSFVYTTTRNLCLNHLKHKKIEFQYVQPSRTKRNVRKTFFWKRLRTRKYSVSYGRQLTNFPLKPGK